MKRINVKKIIISFISCALFISIAFTMSNQLKNHKDNNTFTKRTVQADYPFYKSIEEAYDVSQVVIKGKALDSEVKKITVAANGSLKYDYLVTKVKVSKVLKGTIAEGSIIYVKQLIDTQDVEIAEDSKEKPLEKSSEYYLFLASFGADNSVKPFSIINPEQGNFKISEGKIIAIDKNMTVNSDDKNKKYLDGMDYINFEKEVNNIKFKK